MIDTGIFPMCCIAPVPKHYNMCAQRDGGGKTPFTLYSTK